MTQCISCGVDVLPGHTGHDAGIGDDGEETYLCGECCTCNEGETVKDDIEVTLTFTAEEVEDMRVWASRWPTTVPPTTWSEKILDSLPAPTPPRSEYPLQTVKVAAGCPVVNDSGVVLVPAHSLRSGDEVEWAPGDWRAIDITYSNWAWVGVGVDPDTPTVSLRAMDLVAVRRSGVTG